MIAVERNHDLAVAAATSSGGEAVPEACGLSSREDVERLVARIEGEWAERLYHPYSDGVLSRFLQCFRWLFPRLLGLLEWMGQRGLKECLATTAAAPS